MSMRSLSRTMRTEPVGSASKSVPSLHAHPTNVALAARNLAMQPPLEALRRETQEYYDRALAAQAQWPTVEAEMKEQYRVSLQRTESPRQSPESSHSPASFSASASPLHTFTPK